MCRTGFKGQYCESPSKIVETGFPIWTFLFLLLLLLLIIAACGIAYYFIYLKDKDRTGVRQLGDN